MNGDIYPRVFIEFKTIHVSLAGHKILSLKIMSLAINS